MTDGSGEQPVDGGPAAEPVEFSISLRSLIFITLAITLVIGVAAVLTPADEALTRIGVGLVLALALDPVVTALQRRGLGRRSAGFMVGMSALLIGVFVVVVVGPPTVEQAAKFQEELPETIQGFYDLPIVGDWLEENEFDTKVEEFVEELPARIDDETVENAANTLIGGATSALVVLAVAFAVMLDGPNMIGRIRRLIPESRRQRADEISRVLYATFGRYFGGSVTVAVMSGIWVLLIGLIFDVPLAPVAAMWAMVTNMIPQIGGFLGGSFVTILALSVSVPTAIIVALLFVAYMNFENNVIQPAVIGKAVDLSPPVTMLAALIGGAAAGVPGALVATPIVGSAKRLYFQFVRHEPPEDDDDSGGGGLLKRLFKRGSGDSAGQSASAG